MSHCHPPCPLPDPPRAVSVSTFLENRSGRGAIVLCTAESHPPSWLALHHHGHLLATSLSPAVTPGVRAIPSHNALRVELVAAGTGAGGRYVCVATNALGNATASADFDEHSEWGLHGNPTENPKWKSLEVGNGIEGGGGMASHEGGTGECVGDTCCPLWGGL